MCLVAISWQVHPDFPLLISANRDEFFDRPTAPLHQWKSGIYAGKDLRGGGTWMGFHPNGKWSLLTNYRDFHRTHPGEISRGKLVQNFLEGSASPERYLEQVYIDQDRYDGFNLLVSDGNELFYLSNYGAGIQLIEPGVHGLSNGLINDPWPKVDLAKNQLKNILSSAISNEALLSILKSPNTHPAETLPTTGVPESVEIALSAQLIRMPPKYGTVSASSVLQDKNGLTHFTERNFDWDFANYRDISFSFHT
jgi:uncharacterized protein with NRDE domain